MRIFHQRLPAAKVLISDYHAGEIVSRAFPALGIAIRSKDLSEHPRRDSRERSSPISPRDWPRELLIKRRRVFRQPDVRVYHLVHYGYLRVAYADVVYIRRATGVLLVSRASCSDLSYPTLSPWLKYITVARRTVNIACINNKDDYSWLVDIT